MSTEQNKLITRRWLEAWNTRSVGTLEALADQTFAVGFTMHDKGQPGSPMGREGIKQFVREVLKNTPDIQITIDDIIAEGDRVVYFITINGTNAQTGKPERTMSMSIGRFTNGLLAEAWGIDVHVEP
jgi:predicted SnoaL-like aldol condensation-catalyzing enzyme